MTVTPKQLGEMRFACYLRGKRYISPKQVVKDCAGLWQSWLSSMKMIAYPRSPLTRPAGEHSHLRGASLATGKDVCTEDGGKLPNNKVKTFCF